MRRRSDGDRLHALGVWYVQAWSKGKTDLLSDSHAFHERVNYKMFSYNGSLYSVSWHFLTLTFAHGVPHPFSHKCHAQSKVVFSTNWKSLRDTNEDTHKTKSHHTNVRWCVCTPTCVRTYHGTRRTRHRRNSWFSAVSTHIPARLYKKNEWCAKTSHNIHTFAYGVNGISPLILW